MLSIRDHFSDASQNSAEIQVDLNTALGSKLLESVQRFTDLNALVARVALHETEKMLCTSVRARSFAELALLADAQARVSSRHAASYACNVTGIVAGTQSELLGLLGVQITETNTEIAELVADVSRSAPGSSSRFIHAMRMGFDHANARLEQATHASRKILDTLETNCIAAARQFDGVARQARSRPH